MAQTTGKFVLSLRPYEACRISSDPGYDVGLQPNLNTGLGGWRSTGWNAPRRTVTRHLAVGSLEETPVWSTVFVVAASAHFRSPCSTVDLNKLRFDQPVPGSPVSR